MRTPHVSTPPTINLPLDPPLLTLPQKRSKPHLKVQTTHNAHLPFHRFSRPTSYQPFLFPYPQLQVHCVDPTTSRSLAGIVQLLQSSSSAPALVTLRVIAVPSSHQLGRASSRPHLVTMRRHPHWSSPIHLRCHLNYHEVVPIFIFSSAQCIVVEKIRCVLRSVRNSDHFRMWLRGSTTPSLQSLLLSSSINCMNAGMYCAGTLTLCNLTQS